MIKLENAVLPSPEQWRTIIMGLRNPKNSWDRSDSEIDYEYVIRRGISRPRDSEGYMKIGPNDRDLMLRLAKGGPVHAKYRRMITVYVDITAPLYWWKEFDTYKVGTVANSCSTMHKIHDKEFTANDFSYEKLDDIWGYEPEVRHMAPAIEFTTHTDKITDYVLGPDDILNLTIKMLNRCRELYLETKEKTYWWQMIQLLPSSYNQKRTIMLNYEVLHNMYISRKNHKLDEWVEFCKWIESLPYSELITGKTGNDDSGVRSGGVEDVGA